MKSMAMIAASALLLGRGLAAQDTTKAAAPAAAPAAASPQVTVVEAVVARSRASTTCGSTVTRRWATSSCRWAGRPGARGAARQCRPIGPEPGTST